MVAPLVPPSAEKAAWSRKRVRVGVLALAFAGCGPALAQGCGPTRLKLTETIELDQPPAKVWALIGNFQDLSWDRDAIASRGTGGNVPEAARREVALRGGATFTESLYRYDATAMSYSYHIDKVDVSRLPVQNVSATLEVLPVNGGSGSIVRWKSAFYRYLAPGEGAPDVADANAVSAMKAYLRSALEGIKARIDAKT